MELQCSSSLPSTLWLRSPHVAAAAGGLRRRARPPVCPRMHPNRRIALLYSNRRIALFAARVALVLDIHACMALYSGGIIYA